MNGIEASNDPQINLMCSRRTTNSSSGDGISDLAVRPLAASRYGGADATRTSMLAAELIELRPDVILAAGLSAAVALRQESRSIPIVFLQVADPVSAASLQTWRGQTVTSLPSAEWLRGHADRVFAAQNVSTSLSRIPAGRE